MASDQPGVNVQSEQRWQSRREIFQTFHLSKRLRRMGLTRHALKSARK
jgi:hypothetical protein